MFPPVAPRRDHIRICELRVRDKRSDDAFCRLEKHERGAHGSFDIDGLYMYLGEGLLYCRLTLPQYSRLKLYESVGAFTAHLKCQEWVCVYQDALSPFDRASFLNNKEKIGLRITLLSPNKQ